MSLRDHRLKGNVRTFYSLPAIMWIVVAVSAVVSAPVGIATALFLRGDTNSKVYQQDLASCRRQNQTRVESNLRIGPHTIDRDNLSRLATRLAHTRAEEARAFAAIGRTFHIEAQVAPLITTLRKAQADDLLIVESERRVTFRPLAQLVCSDPDVVQQP